MLVGVGDQLVHNKAEGNGNLHVNGHAGTLHGDLHRATLPVTKGEPLDPLTKEVTDHIQQYTQVGGARPFGVALLIGGIENGTPRLYETDPSGTPYEWKAVSIGAERGDLQEYLEENYRDDLTLDEGIGLALRAIASTNEGQLESGGVDVATVTTETEAFVELDNSEIAEYIAENDLEPTDEDETDEPAE